MSDILLLHVIDFIIAYASFESLARCVVAQSKKKCLEMAQHIHSVNCASLVLLI